ncbi:MAG: helix-turn-helix transcriptional regulator [Bacteriovoracaceae bacterium]|nr:helix-turn-helix transcriptional regulator [Bacteriovoracaceae bacterium]
MTIKKKNYFEELEKEYGKLSFGDVLKAFRASEEISQTDFAKKLGLSIQNVCDIEKGRRIPSPSRTARIAKKLGLPEKAMIEFSIRDSLKSEGLNYNVRLEKSIN